MKPPVLILVGTSHPGNAGATARGAANFGVTDLRFVAPRCDVKGKEAMDRAVHAKPLLESATIHGDLTSALQGVGLSVGTTARSAKAANHFLRKPMDCREFLAALPQVDTQVGYVFGPEDSGLSGDDVNRLDQLVTIPTATYSSLNLSHAAILLSYEHFRLSATSITPERTLAPDALNAMHQAWDDLTNEVEFRDWRQRTAQGVFRKIMGRSLPDTFEVNNIMGILTNALKRFGHPAYATKESETALTDRGLRVKGRGEDPEPPQRP